MDEVIAAPQQRAALRGLRGGSVRLRLKHIILLAVLWSLVVAEFAVLAPAMFMWQRDEVTRLETDAHLLLKANVDATSFPSVADTVRMGQRLTTFSHVRGGLLLNAIGDEIGAFGERPALTFHNARRENIVRAMSPDRQRFDVFYPTETTGFAHHLILRLDASNVPNAVLDRILDKAGVIFVVALISAISVALILSLFIVSPVLKLRDAAMAATDNPDQADNHRLKWKRTDELGDAARAFDLLLTAVSVVHQEDLTANQEAMHRSSHAILAYDPNGRLASANPAALRLFATTSFEELAREPANYIRVKSGSTSVDLTPLELLGRAGDVAQIVTVVTSRTTKRCHLNATTIRKRNGTVLRHIVTLVDIHKQASYQDQLEGEAARLRLESEALRRKVSELKQLFESCLVIMSEGAVPATRVAIPDDAPIVSTDRVVNGWYAEATRSGMVDGYLEHSVLPGVRGQEDAVEALFRQALLAIYVRSPVLQPTISVTAAYLSETTARFEMREGEPARRAQRRPDSGSAAAVIALRALGTLVNQAGGWNLEIQLDGAENAVAFTLPVEAASELPSFVALAETLKAEPRVSALRG